MHQDPLEEFIHNEEELLERLQRIMLRDYGFFILLSPENDHLSVALAGEHGYVEITGGSGVPPYRYAVRPTETGTTVPPKPSSQLPLWSLVSEDRKIQSQTKQSRVKEKLIEFNIAGTPTPIPLSQCVSVQDVMNIILHFFRHQELSKGFEWKEI